MRLGENYFVTCRICGMLGHSQANCSLRQHYHQQAIKLFAAGKADEETRKEAHRQVAPMPQRNAVNFR